MTLVEARRLSDPLLKNKIINYVLTRQNEDGGYCFAQGALESSGQDTYYGLAILSQLNARFPRSEKTLRFLDDNRLDSIYSIYYVTKSKLLLGKGINARLKEELSSLLDSNKYFGSSNFFSDASSEFTTTLMALELARLLKMDVNSREIVEWLLSFRNKDGGFGIRDHSNVDSTYYAVACLLLLNENSKKLNETIKFVRSCEKPHGGFTVIPINYTPYMEHAYYGLMTLVLLGEESRYPAQTIDWVLSCQRSNGGFARSDLGISTFVDTYHAIQILQKIGNYEGE
jgi:hypothetical protein